MQLVISLIVLFFFSATLNAQTLPLQWSINGTYSAGFGSSVANLGDINADGVNDFIVITPSALPVVGSNPIVYSSVYSGVDRSILYTVNLGALSLAEHIQVLGDVNGDGISDFTTTAINLAASVYSGANGNLLSFGGGFVYSVGDVNADGVIDLAYGNSGYNSYTGQVIIKSGTSGVILFTLNGGGIDELFGNSVLGLGDLNGDGHDDFAVGAPQAREYYNYYAAQYVVGSGYVNIYSGINGSVLNTLSGVGYAQRFGFSMARLADLDSDSKPDFAVGSVPFSGSLSNPVPTPSLTPPQVDVYSTSTQAHLHTLVPSNPANKSTFFGYKISDAGDTNGDGVSDIIVGAKLDDTFLGAVDNGSASVFSGVDGSLIQKFNGPQYARYGSGVAGLGDVNGDGFSDVLIGAQTYHNSNNTILGLAQILSICGVMNYGDLVSPLQSLSTSWSFSGNSSGTLSIAGAPPNAAGHVGIGSIATQTTISGVPIYLGNLLQSFQFGFPASGSISGTLGLRNPALAGQVAYLQFFSVNSGFQVNSSNGLELLYCN